MVFKMNSEYILKLLNEEGTYKFDVLLQTEESTFIISQTYERPIIFNFVKNPKREYCQYVPSDKQKEIEYIYNCTVFPIICHSSTPHARLIKIIQPHLFNADYIKVDFYNGYTIDIIRGGMKITHRYDWNRGQICYKRGRCELILDFEHDSKNAFCFGDGNIKISKFTRGMIGYFPTKNGWYKYKYGRNPIILNVGFDGDVGKVSICQNPGESRPGTYYPFVSGGVKTFNLKRPKKCVRQV